MRNVLILFFSLSISSLFAQNFYLHTNGVTCMCPDAAIGDTGVVDGITYTKRTREQITQENAANTCTSGITDMSALFWYAEAFNQDIGTWDVSSVTSMDGMFFGATSFNQDISSWDVSSLTNTWKLFYQATSFNQPLGDWNVSNVTSMWLMFFGATSFNQDISSWDVSNVTSMMDMFRGAVSFNQDISSWDVRNVTDADNMFFGAESFNQDISSWKIDVIIISNLQLKTPESKWPTKFNWILEKYGQDFVDGMERIQKIADIESEKKYGRFRVGGNPPFGLLDLRDVNNYDLKAMVKFFLADCKKNQIEIAANSIKAIFEPLDENTIAMSYGINDDKNILIKVDPENWAKASTQKRWYILYHELGHDVLNFNHGEGGKMMFNFSEKDYTWDEFIEDKSYMFKAYKEN